MKKLVAFLPVRGGSKSVPFKNIRPIAGLPLAFWVVNAVLECELIDHIYVSTDSPAIRDAFSVYQSEQKLTIIGRAPETATDTASTESALMEFSQAYDFDSLILIQATSPLLRAEDLQRGVEMYQCGKYDSVLSVVRQKRFLWAEEKDSYCPVNYDFNNRPRRQDFEGYFVENGAFYINSRSNILRDRCRLSGKVGCVEMDEKSYTEIDEPEDWDIVENLLKRRNTKRLGQDIKMLLTDCDGVLTDGGMYYSDQGDCMKKFNTRDGLGLSLLREKGIITGIITGENSHIVEARAKKLRIPIVELGCTNKLETAKKICKQWGIPLEQVAYIGDDLGDVELIQHVGYGCCVADAVEEVKKAAAYVTNARGGAGAVREVAERILFQEV